MAITTTGVVLLGLVVATAGFIIYWNRRGPKA
jgi:hypothetical protein